MSSTPREPLAGFTADASGAGPSPAAAASKGEPTTFIKGGLAKAGASASGDADRSFNVVDENVGERLDHFELLDCIGVGGMGRVYRGLDTRLDRMVAIKVLSPELANDSEVMRRFEQEAKAAARIDSPHFARVYFFGADKNKHYIAMEFVEGDDLRRRIGKRGRLELDDVVRIGVQIARGLVHSERCGVVHRDIKPSNIIVTPLGVAKLVDMGLARNVVPSANAADDITQAGVTLGTFDYISPEQSVDPRSADIRSDIYSLGCTLFHALAGRPPFGEGGPLQKLLSHQNDPIPDLRSMLADVPDRFVEIIDRMTAKDPNLRYQSPWEVLADLSHFARERGIDLDEFGSVAIHYSPLRHWRDHLVWAGPMLLVVICAIAMAITQRPKRTVLPSGPLLADTPRNGSNSNVAESLGPKPPSDAITNETALRTNEPIKGAASLEIVDVPAEPDGDLRRAILAAKRGQTLRLLGSSYRIAANANADKTLGIVVDKDVSIRGAAGRLTTIELVEDAGVGVVSAEIQRSTFTVTEGELTLEDVRLNYSGPTMLADGPTYVIVEKGGFKALRCAFSAMPDLAAHTGAVVQLGIATSSHACSLNATQSFCFGGPIGVLVEGAGKCSMRLDDCAFRDVTRPVVAKNSGPLNVALERVSMFGGDAPFFSLERLGGASFEVRESVFSQLQRNEKIPLVRVELPGVRGAEVRTWWTGERNLFHGFDAAMVSGIGESPTADFEELARIGFRDSQSKRLVSASWPWLLNDPKRDAGANEADAFRAFRLSVNSEVLKLGRNGEPIGVRSSPWGRLYEEAALAATEATDRPPTAMASVKKPSDSSPDAKETRTSESRTTATALIVDPGVAAGDQPRGVFRNLATACEEAPDGGIIELKGDREIAISDLKFAGKKLTVRSAGVARAKVVFEYTDDQSTGPRVGLGPGADLRFEEVSLSFKGPAPSRSGISLFDLKPGSALTLDGCNIDLAGPAESSLLSIRNGQSGIAPTSTVEPKPAQVLVRRCTVTVVSAVRLESAAPIKFQSEDSRWNCEQALLKAETAAGGMGPADARNRSIAFLRSTVITRDGLLNCTAPDRLAGDGPVNLDILLDQNVIVGVGAAPLARLATVRAGAMEQANLTFQGQLNFFAGFDVYLQVSQSDAAGMLQRPYKFAEWLERTQLDRDTNQQGEADAANVLGATSGKPIVIGMEDLRRLGYREKFAKPPGVDPAAFAAPRRSEPTK